MTVAAAPEIADLAQDLLNEFTESQVYIEDNSLYYESKKRPTAIGLSTPPEMKKLIASIGWPRVYLDSLEERLDIEGFRLAGKAQGTNIGDERLWSWWQYNDLDEWSGLGHLESFIHGRAYITIAAPDPDDPLMDSDKPIIRVESANTMWADVDPRTHRVTRAIRVIRDADGYIDNDRLTIYLPNSTIGLLRAQNTSMSGWNEEWRRDHNLGIVPVVPLLNRSRLTEWYGKSEITEELRSVTDAAARIMMNMQATAELMAIPQRMLFGVSKEELLGSGPNAISTFQAYIGRILAIDKDGVTAQQFAAAELRNFADAIEILAKEAAKYTGLPPQYLAYSSENPASADAIRASETRLVKKAERKQRIFGGSWEQAMRIAILVMDDELPEDAHRLETVWRDPATPTFAAKADAVVKLVSATTASGEQLLPNEQARIELGYSLEQRRQMKSWDRETPRSQLAKVLSPPQFSDNNASDSTME
jgi:hypothetical protein